MDFIVFICLVLMKDEQLKEDEGFNETKVFKVQDVHEI